MTTKYGDLHTTKSWRQISADLHDELRKWGISTYQLPYKDDSVRRGSVTVHLTIDGHERQLTCARFTEGNAAERNFAAIVLAVRSARLADQRGIGSLLADAVALKMLPDPADPYRILGVHPSAGMDEVRAAYKRMVIKHHPDQGGGPELLDAVREAGRQLGVA